MTLAQMQVDARVQLTQDIPELELHRDDVGRVCSTWLAPDTAYEVEFRRQAPYCWVRALLTPSQIQPATLPRGSGSPAQREHTKGPDPC